MFLTETWLKDYCAPDTALALPEGFLIKYVDRVGKTGGGLAVIHRSTLICTIQQIKDTGCIEGITFTMSPTPSFSLIRGSRSESVV